MAAASTLAGTDIRFAVPLWQPYNPLWLEVLHGVMRNGDAPILFAAVSPADLPEDEVPFWCCKVE